MLHLVLLFVLAAFGLLVTALATGATGWAWASVATSVVAGGLLVADGLRRRSVVTSGDGTTGDIVASDSRPPEHASGAGVGHDELAGGPARSAADGEAAADRRKATGPPADPGAPAGSGGEPGSTSGRRPDPPEEDTDAADSLRVAELADEILVVDERPRYHLAGCRWLENRLTLPLPVREARSLGFTPCAHCAPDATLLSRHRTLPR
ncbi:hypothetical protein GCM10012275_06010 [Longimycelium tulufanense]|uniref:Uncharacterized protein n=1 Tax=Longimycelium tulufanense TaxID=907463 RepID=A0A8J3C971_9PSEU|nr:hypothetical protein [Longimycelium tulufanense]GGM37765.1 hypothetical protein GCM10012275_06010 [Longimycelium tulufanense]